MALATPQVRDGAGLMRDAAAGDVLNTQEVIQTETTAGAATLSSSKLITGLLVRTGPGIAFNDTLPSASDLLTALLGNGSYVAAGAISPAGINPGASFRFTYYNGVAFVATLVAGTGITLAGSTAVAASSARTYLITCLNGTPAQTFAGTTTNGSAVVTGLSAAQTSLLSPGMLVTGTGVPAAATVLSVQPGVGITLSANATATGSLVALAFTPRFEVRGLFQAGT